jgi:flagella basal body P-ring formation protein FlgA
MAARRTALILATVIAALAPTDAPAWVLDLADHVEAAPGNVRVADLARGEVPAAAGEVVVVPGAQPGLDVTVTRPTVLRRLVMAGLAAGVSLQGAERCRISIAGEPIASEELEERVRAVLVAHLPEPRAGAPASWIEVDVPAAAPTTASDWTVTWPEARTLDPGRNLVTLAVTTPRRTQRLSVAATVHCFAQTPQAVTPILRDQPIDPAAVAWVWTDLAQASRRAITDAAGLDGMVAQRDIAVGAPITAADLEVQPLVVRGERVDLVVARGTTRAVVTAECRQDGRLGQMVSVLNPITRRLVVARVTAPGVVTMGR